MAKANSVTFEVNMTENTLRHFLLYEAVNSTRGLVGFGFALLCVVFGSFFLSSSVTQAVVIYLIGLVMAIGRPLGAVLGARNAIKQPVYAEPIRYTVAEAGITLVQGEQEGTLSWKEIKKVRQSQNMLLLYTGKGKALLLPLDAMGSKRADVLSIVRRKTGNHRVK